MERDIENSKMGKVPNILISYHSNDLRWKGVFYRHCEQYREKHQLTVLYQEIFGTGEQLLYEEESASYDIVLLIISKDYLSLGMVENGNLERSILNFERNGTKVVLVHAEHCEWQRYEWIKKRELWPNQSNALSDDLDYSERLNRLVSELIRDVIAKKRDTDGNNSSNKQSERKSDESEAEKKIKRLWRKNRPKGPTSNDMFFFFGKLRDEYPELTVFQTKSGDPWQYIHSLLIEEEKKIKEKDKSTSASKAKTMNKKTAKKKVTKKEKPVTAGTPEEAEQMSLQGIIDVLKRWNRLSMKMRTRESFEAVKSVLPPIGQIYEILRRSEGKRGARTADVINNLGSAARDGTGLYPALLNELADPEVIADLENWREKDEGGGKKVVQEVFDTDEDVKVAFEKYLVEVKDYAPENYSTEQSGDEYPITRIQDNEQKVLVLMAFCLKRVGADKAFEGIQEYKKKEGISEVPNYVIFANEDQKMPFAMLEYEDDGTSYEMAHGDFPTYKQLLFASPLSDRGRRICWALTRLAKNQHGFSIHTPCEDYIDLQIKKNKRVAAQIHRLSDSDDNISFVLAGYQQYFPEPKLPNYIFEGELKQLSGYTSKYPGEKNWLDGNLGHKQLKYEAGVYILRPGALVLDEIENEVGGLLELAKSNAESKGAGEATDSGDEGEYHAPIMTYSGDGVRDPEGRLVDQLGIEAEVNAMSSLVAACDIKWPLSIGLFGDWGRGKSFFMEMMYDRVKKISNESEKWVERGNESDYCRNVVQIRFNAWHYMDSNLWASLVTHIFDELAKEVSSRGKADVEETRKVLFENLESAKKLKDEAEEHEKKAADLRESAESKLTKVEEERADAEKELKHITARDVIALAKDDARIKEQCRQVAEKFGLAEIGAEVENIRDIVREANKVFGRVMLVWRTISSRRKGKIKLLGLIGLILGLPVLVGLVAWWVSDSAFAAQLSGVIGIIGSVITGHMKALKPRLAGINKGLAQWEKAQEQILSIGGEATRAEIELREEIKGLKEEENGAQQEVDNAERLVQRAKEELDEIRTGRRLQRLIEEGSRKSEYLDKLGIIAVIRKDFEDLKNLVSESSEQVTSGEFPRIDRIVLYIDDLDRCPSERVVEVLQAVHLILAFELFVVVVAVDSRWILHALHEEYSAFGGVDKVTARLESRWLTTPQNYVEKIFQIPFALRPMGDRGYRQLVGKLVDSEGSKVGETIDEKGDVEVREGGGEQEFDREIPPREEKEVRVDEFKPTIEMEPPSANLNEQEAEFMKAMGDLIPSPRAAKRFVNIYRLTLASVDDQGKLDELRGTKNRPGDYQAVLLMLAILTGFPSRGAEILTTLANGGGKCNGILDFVSKLKTREEPNLKPARYRNGVRKGILGGERAVWDRLSNILKEKIGELGVKDSLEPFVQWAGWVARFSFQYKPVISEEEGGEEEL